MLLQCHCYLHKQNTWFWVLCLFVHLSCPLHSYALACLLRWHKLSLKHSCNLHMWKFTTTVPLMFCTLLNILMVHLIKETNNLFCLLTTNVSWNKFIHSASGCVQAICIRFYWNTHPRIFGGLDGMSQFAVIRVNRLTQLDHCSVVCLSVILTILASFNRWYVCSFKHSCG